MFKSLRDVDWTDKDEVIALAKEIHEPGFGNAVVWNEDFQCYNIIPASRVGDDARPIVFLSETLH